MAADEVNIAKYLSLGRLNKFCACLSWKIFVPGESASVDISPDCTYPLNWSAAGNSALTNLSLIADSCNNQSAKTR